MSDNQVCNTFDAAIEMAIQMENEGFRHYLAAMRKVTNKGGREILRENALEELNHKYQLERALLDGKLGGGEILDQAIPPMHLDYVFTQQELRPDYGLREALIYAIHLEKGAVDFYGKVAKGCAGAPMAGLFSQLHKEESRHLQKLEDFYGKHFMAEN